MCSKALWEQLLKQSALNVDLKYFVENAFFTIFDTPKNGTFNICFTCFIVCYRNYEKQNI